MSKADDTGSENWNDGLEKGWTNPFARGTWLYRRFDKIVRENRDIVIILDDYHANRGTGKTVASLQLANGMDQNGGLTYENVSLEPEPLRNAYANLPKRSGLVLDEGEIGASNKQAMSKTNQALREIMSMGRVQQKYVVVNSPAKDFIDKDILKLADVWISLTKKGGGIVHALERQPYSGAMLTPKKQLIEFQDIPGDHDLRSVYRKLTRDKQNKIQGEDGASFISQDEHQEKLRKARKQAKKELRNEVIENLYTHPDVGLSQSLVAECTGVSQGTVSNIITSSD